MPFSIGSNEEHRRKFRDYLKLGISCIFSEIPIWVNRPLNTSLHSIFSKDVGEDNEMEDNLIRKDNKIEDNLIRKDDEIEDDIISEELPSSLFIILYYKIFTSKIKVSDKLWNEIYLNR